MVPVVATLAMAEPVDHAHQGGGEDRHLGRTAGGLTHPGVREKSLIKREKPLYFKKAPNTTNRKM